MSTVYNFNWDKVKAKINWDKHGVNFSEATSIFYDPNAVTIYDEGHSLVEERWITIGLSKEGKLLVVCHTFQEEKREIFNLRIYSCRKASQKEKKQYGENL